MNLDTKNYEAAKKVYAEFGIDTDQALKQLKNITISVPCWQLDDVQGFEDNTSELTGGIAVTGDYPGKPDNITSFQEHVKLAMRYIPGNKKLSLHAIYLDSKDPIDRNEIQPKHFASWVKLAKEQNFGLDFNPTLFSHKKSLKGTLSHPDKTIRKFWIEHVKRSRRIGEYFGRELGQKCITNIWIPDGSKEVPIDTLAPRKRLKESLDEIFKDNIDSSYNMDSVESKLFGIGTESYVVGSHEFYTNYVMNRDDPSVMICLDAGHYHPTEIVSQKLSSYLAFNKSINLHVSRPVRWDSDHIVLFDDETMAIAREIVRMKAFDRINIGLDFFDGTINRVMAVVIGARSIQKALLKALLEPTEALRKLENNSNYSMRMALQEELKTLPFGYIWDYYCKKEGVESRNWMTKLEEETLS